MRVVVEETGEEGGTIIMRCTGLKGKIRMLDLKRIFRIFKNSWVKTKT